MIKDKAARINMMKSVSNAMSQGVLIKLKREKEEAERKERESQGLLASIFQIGGAVIGGAVGGPIGASIGGSLGGMAGGKDTTGELQKSIGKLDLSSIFGKGGQS